MPSAAAAATIVSRPGASSDSIAARNAWFARVAVGLGLAIMLVERRRECRDVSATRRVELLAQLASSAGLDLGDQVETGSGR